MRRIWICGIYALAVFGCGPKVALSQSDGGTADAGDGRTSGAPTTTTTTTITTITTTTTTTSPTTVTTTGDDGWTTSGATFIVVPDGYGGGIECDLWTGEPCAPGFKCMPWANDGGSSWNATKCSPIAPDPGAPGDPCMVEGSGVSGVDDCEAHSMCWDVDPETNAGTCVSFCTGSEANPSCPEPCQYCTISAGGVLNLCLPNCDPLLQNCGPGQACYPLQDSFVCAPDASGDMGTAGDPCEFLNACDPGYFCANADSVLGCVGSLGCCAPYCDLADADPCPGLEPPTECIPYFEDPPPDEMCYGEVGACLVP